MFINAMVGGTPGRDCGGFCKFCYFKGTDYNNLGSLSIGCRHCPTNHIGCDHCMEVIRDIKNGFRPLSQVLSRLENVLNWYEFIGTIPTRNIKIVTASLADITGYPPLMKLLETINNWGYPVHMGYTSGKGIKDGNQAEKFVSAGVVEVNFSILSLDPEIRRTWMGDETPDESFKALRIFCDQAEVNASTVVIPGVIDQEEIMETCSTLEEWGVKSFILSRFVNYPRQGLIYNSRPVIEGMQTQSPADFLELVRSVDDEFSFKVIGSPGNLYELSKKGNQEYLKKLPEVTGEATLVTSELSKGPLSHIFERIAPNQVNVISADKEIGDLITHGDLKKLNLDDVKEKVVIPGGALVHDKAAEKILSRDGIKRMVIRGPAWLFYFDVENFKDENKLEYEMKNFKRLIRKINYL